MTRWLINTGAVMVVGRGRAPAWEHRLIGHALLHVGIALLKLSRGRL